MLDFSWYHGIRKEAMYALLICQKGGMIMKKTIRQKPFYAVLLLLFFTCIAKSSRLQEHKIALKKSIQTRDRIKNDLKDAEKMITKKRNSIKGFLGAFKTKRQKAVIQSEINELIDQQERKKAHLERVKKEITTHTNKIKEIKKKMTQAPTRPLPLEPQKLKWPTKKVPKIPTPLRNQGDLKNRKKRLRH